MTLILNHLIGFGAETPYSAFSADPDVNAYLAAMTVPPGPSYVGLVESAIIDLMTDGVFAKLRWLSFFGLHDEQAGRVNAKVPSEVAAKPGSLIFTADRGFTGTGLTADVLDTGLPDSTLTDTDASMFAFVLARATTGTNIMGYNSVRGRINHSTGSTNVAASIQTSSSSIRSGAGNNQFMAVRRTGASQVLSIDTPNGNTATVATSTLSNTDTIRFLGSPSSASNTQLFAAGFGAYLTDTERNALNTHIRTLATALRAI